MRIKVGEMFKVLNTCPEHPKLFIGPPGIGKTQIISQWVQRLSTEDRKVRLYVIPLSHFDIDDLKGIPYISVADNKDEIKIKRGPLIPAEDEDAVVFFDEITTVGSQGLAIALKAIDERQIGYFRFPKSYVVLAGNPPEWEGFRLDSRIISRVNVFEVEPDVEAFVNYMYRMYPKSELLPIVTAFLYHDKRFIVQAFKDGPFPCPRTWEKVIRYGNYCKNDDKDFRITYIGSCVGEGVAVALLKFYEISESFKILNDVLDVKKPLPKFKIDKLDIGYTVAVTVANKVQNEAQVHRLFEFLKASFVGDEVPCDLLYTVLKIALMRNISLTKMLFDEKTWNSIIETFRAIK